MPVPATLPSRTRTLTEPTFCACGCTESNTFSQVRQKRFDIGASIGTGDIVLQPGLGVVFGRNDLTVWWTLAK
jgi:hypothetical protein